MKRMLINATQPEEVRIALVDGQKLFDLDVETPHHQKKKANIYKGTITRIEPSLEAAFVDYGSERHGFLPFKEVAEQYYPENHQGGRLSIQEVLKEGQEVIVQVQKEERGNKGAALSTQITLAGPYVVMMPNNPKAGGISRRIEGDERSETRDALSDIDMPEGMGLIIRTAGVGKTTEELQWGVNYLVQLWEAIQAAAVEKSAPFLIHQESDIVILAIRDYLRQDIGEIIVDDMETFYKARDFIQHVMPHQVHKVKPYQDTIPLFTRFQIESQIESAYQREVVLPSGGVIVIDITEALTAIDINSSRSTKGGDIEETAFHTNLEAATEIARQLRLRDIGGLVVIDFIDMHSNRHQREVENKMRDSVRSDRARVQIGKISRFGLLEMSRQRLRPSIEEATQIVCPRCKGVGVIRGVESLALSILRLLEEESMKENTKRVTVQLPVDVATFLLNEKRHQITHIEDRHKLHILIVPNEHIETPNYIIERSRIGDDSVVSSSYKLKEFIEAPVETVQAPTEKQKEEPAIKNMQPSTPPPPPKAEVAEQAATPGFFARLWGTLFSKPEAETQTDTETTSRTRTNGRNDRNDRNRNDRNRNGRNRNGRRRTGADNAEDTTEEVVNTENKEQSASDNGNRTEAPRKDRNRRRRNGRNRTQSDEVENAQDNDAIKTTDNDASQTNEATRSNDSQTNKPSSNVAAERAAIGQDTVNDQEDAAQSNDSNDDSERRPRRRSRYSTRNYNSRRRLPLDAEQLSIHNIPEQTTATDTVAATDAEAVPAETTVTEQADNGMANAPQVAVDTMPVAQAEQAETAKTVDAAGTSEATSELPASEPETAAMPTETVENHVAADTPADTPTSTEQQVETLSVAEAADPMLQPEVPALETTDVETPAEPLVAVNEVSNLEAVATPSETDAATEGADAPQVELTTEPSVQAEATEQATPASEEVKTTAAV